MNYFLIDGNCSYTYQDLFDRINSTDRYKPYYKHTSLFNFYVNFITALISDKPVVLIDADMSISEITNLVDEDWDLDKEIIVSKKRVDSFEDLLEIIQRSSSQIIMFTSGTTGRPKKIIHYISSLTRSVYKADKYKDQRWLFTYNPTHMAGVQVFLQAFYNMNLLVNVFTKSRDYIYDVINTYKITNISATPTFYRMLLPYTVEFPSVIRTTYGGEGSNEKLYNVISQIFPNAKSNNVYASTEAGALFASKGNKFVIPQNLISKCKIVDGELMLHKSLMGNSDSYNLVGDFYPTGDLIEWVEDGVFKIVGRKSELINVGGYKINPEEVESALMSLKKIEQAVVYSKSNSILGNILCADVKLIDGNEMTEFEVRKSLSFILQDFKIPRRIKFVKEIVLTRTGKIKRK